MYNPQVIQEEFNLNFPLETQGSRSINQRNKL